MAHGSQSGHEFDHSDPHAATPGSHPQTSPAKLNAEPAPDDALPLTGEREREPEPERRSSKLDSLFPETRKGIHLQGTEAPTTPDHHPPHSDAETHRDYDEFANEDMYSNQDMSVGDKTQVLAFSQFPPPTGEPQMPLPLLGPGLEGLVNPGHAREHPGAVATAPQSAEPSGTARGIAALPGSSALPSDPPGPGREQNREREPGPLGIPAREAFLLWERVPIRKGETLGPPVPYHAAAPVFFPFSEPGFPTSYPNGNPNPSAGANSGQGRGPVRGQGPGPETTPSTMSGFPPPWGLDPLPAPVQPKRAKSLQQQSERNDEPSTAFLAFPPPSPSPLSSPKKDDVSAAFSPDPTEFPSAPPAPVAAPTEEPSGLSLPEVPTGGTQAPLGEGFAVGADHGLVRSSDFARSGIENKNKIESEWDRDDRLEDPRLTGDEITLAPTGRSRAIRDYSLPMELTRSPCLTVLEGRIPGTLYELNEPVITIGRSSENTIQIPIPTISRRHLQLELCDDATVRVRDLGSSNGTFVNQSEKLSPHVPVFLRIGDILNVGTTLRLRYGDLTRPEIESARAAYERLVRDPLTQLPNGLYFQDEYETHAQRMYLGYPGFAVMLVDLDQLHLINTVHGYDVGDQTLREVARIFQETMPAPALIARRGHEEFVAGFGDSHYQHAVTLAEQLRERIERTPIPTRHGPARHTVSIGLAYAGSLRPRDPQDLFAQADQCLFLAKDQGRNRVVAVEAV